MSAHLSFDELAELVEGLLARRPARAAQDHLATCDDCSERAALLQATTDSLHELGPITMPADVATRLDRALAAAGDAPAGDTVVPDLGTVRRRRQALPPWTYAAAAAVVVIAAVSTVLASQGGRHAAPNELAASAPPPLVATSERQALVQQDSGRVYTPTSLTALAPGLVDGGFTTGSDNAGTSASAAGGNTAQEPQEASPLHAAGLPQASPTQQKNAVPPVPMAASGAVAEPQQEYSSTAVPRALRPFADSRSKLLACAAFITDTSGAAPLAVDFARWTNPNAHDRRTPALVLVFDDPQDSSELDVYVVAPACDDSSLLAFTVAPANG